MRASEETPIKEAKLPHGLAKTIQNFYKKAQDAQSLATRTDQNITHNYQKSSKLAKSTTEFYP